MLFGMLAAIAEKLLSQFSFELFKTLLILQLHLVLKLNMMLRLTN
jgi:hypothetical protein